jgi:hypothetical protein
MSLTDAAIRTAKPAAKPRNIFDGGRPIAEIVVPEILTTARWKRRAVR